MKDPRNGGIVFHRLRYRSPIGGIECLFDESAVVALDFGRLPRRTRALLARHFGTVRIEPSDDRLGIASLLDRYFAGDIRALERVPVRHYGTEFQQKVWTALRRIPAGRTTSYGALARKLGLPHAQRAVGAANGANPIAIVVPCHRVIGSNDALVGYGGGIERKRWLLRHEGAMP
jgi:O-6-methylguanine DNA methyltransferase